jgi:predicted transcriptional regulator
MTKSHHQIDPFSVRVEMMRKRITGRQVARKFRVTEAAVSMAISGQRKTLLRRVARYVQSLKGRQRP